LNSLRISIFIAVVKMGHSTPIKSVSIGINKLIKSCLHALILRQDFVQKLLI
jgi:hypothetical protein